MKTQSMHPNCTNAFAHAQVLHLYARNSFKVGVSYHASCLYSHTRLANGALVALFNSVGALEHLILSRNTLGARYHALCVHSARPPPGGTGQALQPRSWPRVFSSRACGGASCRCDFARDAGAAVEGLGARRRRGFSTLPCATRSPGSHPEQRFRCFGRPRMPFSSVSVRVPIVEAIEIFAMCRARASEWKTPQPPETTPMFEKSADRRVSRVRRSADVSKIGVFSGFGGVFRALARDRHTTQICCDSYVGALK